MPNRRPMQPQPPKRASNCNAYIQGKGWAFLVRQRRINTFRYYEPPADMPGARPVLVGEEWGWEMPARSRIICTQCYHSKKRPCRYEDHNLRTLDAPCSECGKSTHGVDCNHEKAGTE